MTAGRRKAALTALKNDDLAKEVGQLRRLDRWIEQLEAELAALRAGRSPADARDGVVNYGELEEERLLAERVAMHTARLTSRLGLLRVEHQETLERIAVIQRMIQKIEEKNWD